MSTGNRRRWSLTFAHWHRWAGISAALFVIVLAVTGLLLQHAPALGLDRAAVGSISVARWLGHGGGDVTAFRVGERWLLGTPAGLWLDEQRIADLDAPPDGAVDTAFGFAVAAGGGILLLDREGRVVEHLRPGAGLPLTVRRIGHDDDGNVVLQGSRTWQPGPDWLDFRRRPQAEATWIEPGEPPAALAATVREGELARSVTWQRLLLELHSGRIAGPAGVVVMDVAAFALLVLAGTGLYLWWRRR